MVTYRFVDLHIPEAKVLADLNGIRADLINARDYALALQTLMSTEKPDWSLVEPLSIAVAVAYSRAFTTGVRERLGEPDLVMLGPSQREAHERIRAYRDKHVAHSVNVFEHNQPRAHYWAERVEAEGIVAIACSHGRVASLSTSDLENVAELTTRLLAHLESRIAGEQVQLLEIVRKMPLEEVLAGGQGAFRVDTGTPINKARKR